MRPMNQWVKQTFLSEGVKLSLSIKGEMDDNENLDNYNLKKAQDSVSDKQRLYKW